MNNSEIRASNCDGCGKFLEVIEINGLLLCHGCLQIKIDYEKRGESCSCHINPPCAYCTRFTN